MNGSGLAVPSLTFSGTHSAAIGAVVQPHFRNSLASYCNRLLSGRDTKFRFKFLVASSAFGFENLTMNLFGCELSPNPPVDDYYTLQGGGAGQPDAKLPSPSAVEKAVPAVTTVAAPKEQVGFIQPTGGQSDVKPSGSDSIGADLDRQQALAEAREEPHERLRRKKGGNPEEKLKFRDPCV